MMFALKLQREDFTAMFDCQSISYQSCAGKNLRKSNPHEICQLYIYRERAGSHGGRGCESPDFVILVTKFTIISVITPSVYIYISLYPKETSILLVKAAIIVLSSPRPPRPPSDARRSFPWPRATGTATSCQEWGAAVDHVGHDSGWVCLRVFHGIGIYNNQQSKKHVRYLHIYICVCVYLYIYTCWTNQVIS